MEMRDSSTIWPRNWHLTIKGIIIIIILMIMMIIIIIVNTIRSNTMPKFETTKTLTHTSLLSDSKY